MNDEKKSKYIRKQEKKNLKFINKIQGRESYLMRLFKANCSAKGAKMPLQDRIKEKRDRWMALGEEGIDGVEDGAISAWSELDGYDPPELVPAHVARACRLPSPGAVSINAA